MTNSVVRFTDSWGLTWWVFEEHRTRHLSLDGQTVVIADECRLCFSTNMMTRAINSCPPAWWHLNAARLEALCSYATPCLVYTMPANVRPEACVDLSLAAPANPSSSPLMLPHPDSSTERDVSRPSYR